MDEQRIREIVREEIQKATDSAAADVVEIINRLLLESLVSHEVSYDTHISP